MSNDSPASSSQQTQVVSDPVSSEGPPPLPRLSNYEPGGFFDELVDPNSIARPDTEALVQMINDLPGGELARRQRAIERALYQMGITFTVYSDTEGTEKIMPFDIVPRVVPAMLWQHIEAGLKQRIKALNLFLGDIYNEQNILNDGVIPRELVESSPDFRRECLGLRPPGNVWCHVTGTDLIRDAEAGVYVLEDNLRCPSGVSYVLQNRAVMKKNFPQLFSASRVRPVNDYPAKLYDMLHCMSPRQVSQPTIVVLTPGVYNSAYYEHSFLAQQMGVELVEGRDLIVIDDCVMMKTTTGLQQVDVIYRRIDDAFMDPEVFRADSVLGVPGLMRAYRAGNVALANAPGTGIADDKVIYAYVPDMIRYYLNEQQILANVQTYVCLRDDDRDYVLSHLDELVVKAANESGGYGILIGPHATPNERAAFGKKIQENPRNFIAQPTLSLSRVPTLVGESLEGRHVDLRPYILCSSVDNVDVMPGGLTRVALKRGSLVVNSSQGGGSKDTWVVSNPAIALDEATESP
ncbi:MAG: circularly permuted type 2 ATP-grasp protein [Planctomycetota bacterium]